MLSRPYSVSSTNDTPKEHGTDNQGHAPNRHRAGVRPRVVRTLRAAAGPPSRPARRGPGTFAKRNGAGAARLDEPALAALPRSVAARHIASATSSGLQEREPRLREARPLVVLVEHRRVGDPGADRVDPDRRELRRDRADEADDRVLRQRVDRVERHPDEPRERGGDDDRRRLPSPARAAGHRRRRRRR